MKIAIISDTHDNFANIKKVIDWLNKEEIKILLHCGDINSQDAIDEINNNFNGEAKFVRGNADHNLGDLQEVEEIEVSGNPPSSILRRARKIVITHFLEKAEDLAASGKYDLVFYGHTHKPWEEKIPTCRSLLARRSFSEGGSLGEGGRDCRLVNPGEVAGQFYKATFAVYDASIDKLELKIMERL